jgi:UTP--glucose-1-phosphate uridylyltransferase
MRAALHTVIIPAAGLGTRLLPATKAIPKELLPIYDVPAIQFALDEAVAAGARRIIVVVGPGKTALRDYLQADETLTTHLKRKGKHALVAALQATGAPEGVTISLVEQPEPQGLGHAIQCCAALLTRAPFGVILPDDVIFGEPALGQMAAAYNGGHMVAAQMVQLAEVSSYGIFRPARPGAVFPARGPVAVTDMVEKPRPSEAPSQMAAVGRYILDPSIFGQLVFARPGAGDEVQLTDAIAADARFMRLTAFLFSGKRFDCGTHEGLLAASITRRDALGSRLNYSHQLTIAAM